MQIDYQELERLLQPGTADEIAKRNRRLADLSRELARELLERQRWIPVETKLPTIGDQVVAWKPRLGKAVVVTFSQHALDHLTCTRRDGQWWDCGNQITHWMPLPAPPIE